MSALNLNIPPCINLAEMVREFPYLQGTMAKDQFTNHASYRRIREEKKK